ncbi:MAG: hypothetical protein E6Q97_20455 [Desulfurellales bacterium]|nr:MAG: hypothetical protein E6Q97_20455 [Desulfurellales bacterium]
MTDVLIWTGPVSAAMLDPLADVPTERQRELRSMFATSTSSADFRKESEATTSTHAKAALVARANEIDDGLKCSSVAPLVLTFNTWTLKTYNQPYKNDPKRIGSQAFGEWANTLGSDPLTALAGPDATRIVMAGFSAAHGAHEVILGKVALRKDPRLVGLYAADSYYSAWGVQTPKPGHRAWLRMAIEYGLPAWFSTSTRHPAAHPSATESFLIMANSLGMLPVDYDKELSGNDVPDPRSVRKQGSVMWFEYGDSLQHPEHATKLAPIALSKGPFVRVSPQPLNRISPQGIVATAPAPAPNTQSGSNAGRNILLGLTAIGLGWVMYKATS